MGGVSGVRLRPLVAGAHACTLMTLLVFAVMTAVPAGAPLAWSGARGMPLAWLFNLLAWCGPGFVVAFAAWRLRAALPEAGLGAGIALRLWLLAALAFAAQGVWTLDPNELDAGASRWHATAWMVWNLAFGAGALMAAFALRAVRWPSLVICALVALSLLVPSLFGDQLGARMVLVGWWGWTLLLAWRLPSRR
ncbi:conserved membrane hypothetical protein [Luteimonas sp. 9C]|uniref:hypothetical protein n=1 Tax=Luteimonas sp. 9C TaxID=2653148 RepID=UPI0012F19C2C|nr:hypothetical protein [Luteimonas sp. 9C]VXB51956.1 conserved membrane hypothetical protein [Luteimonas sp. 9C]